MARNPELKSDYTRNQPTLFGWKEKISLKARTGMFALLMEMVKPTPTMTVLDVGVTSDLGPESNFFEKWYPYPKNITALGIEDASHLEKEFPGIKYVRGTGKTLPFPDQSFDLVVSFAVLEHVGSNAQQADFLKELCRVGKSCFLTTPNRWYPVEFHTCLPLIHWLPKRWFRKVAALLGYDFYSKEENLNLLTQKELNRMYPKQSSLDSRFFKFLGFNCNLIVHSKS